MKRWTLCTLILFLFVPSGLVQAQEQGQVVLQTVIEKEVEVVTGEGKREISLVEVENAAPGDELIFTVHYTNTGSEPASNVVIVNPVPENTTYVEGTASGEGTSTTFSVDGGATYGNPAELSVIGADGKSRKAVPGDYTHIRWGREKALEAGESGSVVFRATLK